jgi:hypothetical protein
MAETYTPDTDEVREAALFWAAGRGRGTTPEDYDAARAAFDRWLAGIWDEGFRAGRANASWADNPYRSTQ